MEKQMHIAMLIGALTKGGAERVLVNLADYFVEKGYHVTMVTQYERENEYPLNRKVNRIISDITEEETTQSDEKNEQNDNKKTKCTYDASKKVDYIKPT